jgi:hypothetical protein
MSIFAPIADTLRDLDDRTRVETRPPAKGGPVLMADCTTPIAGETLLSLLWKRWDGPET